MDAPVWAPRSFPNRTTTYTTRRGIKIRRRTTSTTISRGCTQRWSDLTSGTSRARPHLPCAICTSSFSIPTIRSTYCAKCSIVPLEGSTYTLLIGSALRDGIPLFMCNYSKRRELGRDFRSNQSRVARDLGNVRVSGYHESTIRLQVLNSKS